MLLTPVTISAGGSLLSLPKGTEGSPASFTLTRDGQTDSPLTVYLSITETGDMVAAANEGQRTVTFPANAATATYDAPTVDDGADEPDSTVTVTVDPGAGHALGSPGSAQVIVQDDDLPVVTISAGGSAVTEGSPASFTLTRDGQMDSPLTVNLSVTETGEMVVANTGQPTVTFPANAATATYDAPTVDDGADEPDSTVTVTVAAGAGYDPGSPGSAQVIVQDNDDQTNIEFFIIEAEQTGIFIRRVSSDGFTITEGLRASYQVGLRTQPSAPVAVQPASTSPHIWVNTGSSGPLRFTPENWSQPLFVQLFTSPGAADPQHQDGWNITHTVTSDDPNYDGDSATYPLTIVGENAADCTAPPAPALILTTGQKEGSTDGTYVSVTAMGITPRGGSCGSIPIVGYDTSIQFIHEDGETVSPWYNYANTRSGAPSHARGSLHPVVQWHTARDYLPYLPGQTYRVKVRGMTWQQGATPWSEAAEVTVPVPEPETVTVTISAGGSAVTEGSPASFALTRDGDTDSPLTVNLSITETGDMVVANTGQPTVTFPANAATVSFDAPTVDDGADEPDSTVTVTVAAGTGYAPGQPGSAQVTVRDNDLPTVTISAGGSPVTEGSPASFVLTRDGDTDSPLTVYLSVMETGYVVALATGDHPTVTFPAGAATAAFDAATVDDSADEPDSTVTVWVDTGADYAPGQPGSAQVTVQDNDLPAPREETNIKFFTPVVGQAGAVKSLASSDGFTITEGLRVSYLVGLRTQPTAPVAVQPASTSPHIWVNTETGGPLRFTPGNWTQPQYVQLYTSPGAADADYQDGWNITHTVTSADPNYDGDSATYPIIIVGENAADCTAPPAPALRLESWERWLEDEMTDEEYLAGIMRFAMTTAMLVTPSAGSCEGEGMHIVSYDTAIQFIHEGGETVSPWYIRPNASGAFPSLWQHSLKPSVRWYYQSDELPYLPGQTYRVKLRGMTWQQGATPWSEVAEITVPEPEAEDN